MSWIGFDKVHRVIKFNQKACSKPYIDMITELRKKPKNDFARDFFKLISNSVFGKTMENVSKHRNIKHLITEKEETIQCQNYDTRIQTAALQYT